MTSNIKNTVNLETSKEIAEAEIDSINERHITISWSDKRGFFGLHTIHFNKEKQKWLLDTETLGKNHMKKVFNALIDSLEKE